MWSERLKKQRQWCEVKGAVGADGHGTSEGSGLEGTKGAKSRNIDYVVLETEEAKAVV
jgi:hypothetical protein